MAMKSVVSELFKGGYGVLPELEPSIDLVNIRRLAEQAELSTADPIEAVRGAQKVLEAVGPKNWDTLTQNTWLRYENKAIVLNNNIIDVNKAIEMRRRELRKDRQVVIRNSKGSVEDIKDGFWESYYLELEDFELQMEGIRNDPLATKETITAAENYIGELKNTLHAFHKYRQMEFASEDMGIDSDMKPEDAPLTWVIKVNDKTGEPMDIDLLPSALYTDPSKVSKDFSPRIKSYYEKYAKIKDSQDLLGLPIMINRNLLSKNRSSLKIGDKYATFKIETDSETGENRFEIDDKKTGFGIRGPMDWMGFTDWGDIDMSEVAMNLNTEPAKGSFGTAEKPGGPRIAFYDEKGVLHYIDNIDTLKNIAKRQGFDEDLFSVENLDIFDSEFINSLTPEQIGGNFTEDMFDFKPKKERGKKFPMSPMYPMFTGETDDDRLASPAIVEPRSRHKYGVPSDIPYESSYRSGRYEHIRPYFSWSPAMISSGGPYENLKFDFSQGLGSKFGKWVGGKLRGGRKREVSTDKSTQAKGPLGFSELHKESQERLSKISKQKPFFS
jgi:hypothetical protein